MLTDAVSAPTRPFLVPVAGYRALRVWQRALDLAVGAAPLARTLAAEGHAGLATDLFRAGTAVPAHIAAGSVAGSRADHLRALGAATTAVARFETLIATAERLSPQSVSTCTALLAAAGEVTRQLRAFSRAVGGAPPASPPSASRPHAHAPTATADEPTPSTPDATPSGAVTPDLESADSAPPATEPAPTPATTDGVPPPMPAAPARTRRARSARSARSAGP